MVNSDKTDHFLHQIQNLNQFQQLMTLPLHYRISVITGLLTLTAGLIFAGLYLLMGKWVAYGVAASTVAGMATAIGALPALYFSHFSSRFFTTMLGLAAGIMLSASAFSLILPGIEFAKNMYPDMGIWVVTAGILAGAGFLHLADAKLPHLHFDSVPETHQGSLEKISLFILAITIHNFPEGLAVGVGFGSGDIQNGFMLMLAISIQNLPEGLAVALPLVSIGFNKWKAVGIALLTGLVEPIGALLGVTLVSFFSSLLPFAMGFAAGAMLFVICEEIIPESHSNGRSRSATFALITGFIVMMSFEQLLG